ncbi:hypothetical protein [Agromyces bracchium]|uniref:Uncharacterized protein n=1 Tax=Agromyces bracchium TaxID=88376 RepID=A0A6I3MF32_9MICO|nr:hypothetical protein [Agromyces bracchium]MTH68903.1 hypothetical protein [Agromyces bracchium]
MATDLVERLRAAGRAVAGSAPVRWARRHKRALAIAVMVAFFAFIIGYIALNPSIIDDVLSVGWGTLALLLGLYTVILVTHFGILESTIRLSGHRLPFGEGLLLTVYSTVSNFFGPLQSGPGIRAAYLKTRLGMRLRDYTYATLYYFFVFAVLNGALLFCTTLPWLSALGLVVGAVLIVIVVRRVGLSHRWPQLAAIGAVTVAQVFIMATIYFVEINAVGTGAYTFAQAIVYSASANLSLFVSITPGAIGFREGFLIFAEGLHGVPVDTIVAAGIVDRAFYALFLGLLFVISSIFHVGRMLRAKSGTELDRDAVDGE